MEWALAVLLKPIFYFVFYVLVIHWLVKLAWKAIPDGKVKRFLFKRR